MARKRVLVPAAVLGAMGVWLLSPYTWFYRNHRPTRAGKLLNGFWARIFSTGVLPSYLVGLETRGRRSGLPRVNSLVVGDYEGERFLVSMLGERSEWVRNARAAGGDAYLRSGRRAHVRLEEVPVERRAPIIKAYLQRALGARPHIEISPDAPLEAFEAVAREHPVFRIVPAGD